MSAFRCLLGLHRFDKWTEPAQSTLTRLVVLHGVATWEREDLKAPTQQRVCQDCGLLEWRRI